MLQWVNSESAKGWMDFVGFVVCSFVGSIRYTGAALHILHAAHRQDSSEVLTVDALMSCLTSQSLRIASVLPVQLTANKETTTPTPYFCNHSCDIQQINGMSMSI